MARHPFSADPGLSGSKNSSRAPSLPEEENYQGVHMAPAVRLAGQYCPVAHEGSEYLGARNRKLQIFPGLLAVPKKTEVDGRRGDCRNVPGVCPRRCGNRAPLGVWTSIPTCSSDTTTEPRWHAVAVAGPWRYERITLYGLTVADKRSVHYGPIAPAESRES